MKSLPLIWTKGMSKADKDNFEALLRNSTTLIDRMKTILDEMERTLDTTDNSLKQFDNPSWPNKQAFILGQRAAIKDLRELISFAD